MYKRIKKWWKKRKEPRIFDYSSIEQTYYGHSLEIGNRLDASYCKWSVLMLCKERARKGDFVVFITPLGIVHAGRIYRSHSLDSLSLWKYLVNIDCTDGWENFLGNPCSEGWKKENPKIVKEALNYVSNLSAKKMVED